MNRPLPSLIRSFPLASLCAAALLAPRSAAQCTGAISADVAHVSLSSGGVQSIALSVSPEDAERAWQVLGAFGADQPAPFLAYGGLRLNSDRYLLRMYNGHAGFVQGVVPGFIGGPLVPFDAQGQAQIQVVVPAGLPTTLLGTTLYHGMYRVHPLTLLPSCGTGTVPLTLVP